MMSRSHKVLVMITRSCPWLRYSFSNAGALAYHIGMKLAKTLRLDVSDTYVFDRAAETGEWAITGTFARIELFILLDTYYRSEIIESL